MISGHDLSKCKVLHVLMPLVTLRACLFVRYCHIRNVRTGSETIYAHSKEYISKFFAGTHTILELDLGKHDVLRRLVPSVLSYACLFMRYHYIREVRMLQTLYIIYSHSKE